MSKVVLSGHILVSEGALAAVREALPVHRELTRAESGCLVFNVDEDPNQVGKFDVYEEFDSQKAFKKHQERVAASEWGNVSRDAERFYTVEEVS
jgi:quinol monooxygenase YgiN